MSEEFEIDRVNWHPAAGGDNRNRGTPMEVTVKIRYAHPGTKATLHPLPKNCARLELHEPQKAVTPGQAAVFYDGDVVLGGGWICRQGALAPA